MEALLFLTIFVFMFDSLRNLINRFSTIQVSDILVSIYKVDKDFVKFVLDVNRIDQIYVEGEDVDGNIIGTYSYLTAAFDRTGTKIYNEPYNLKDSGVFFDSFKLSTNDNGDIIITNDDKKETNSGVIETAELYPNVLGINKDNISKIIEKILPLFREEIRKRLLQ